MNFPRIKPSLKLIPRDTGEIYIGTASQGFLLAADPYLPILRSCDGCSTITEISGRTYLRIELLQSAINELRELGIIELLDRPVMPGYSKHTSNSGGDQQSSFSNQLRSIESSLITHRSGDGGGAEWQAREKFSVVITGDTRVARILLPLLQASGFPRAHIADDICTPQQFDIRDINALTVTVDEIGKNKGLHDQELIRRSSLRSRYGAATVTSDQATRSNLIIATSPPRADQIQHWQSEGAAHVSVGDLIGTEIEISPIISPGLTPCLRCISLHKADALPRDLQRLSYPDSLASGYGNLQAQLPVGSATLIAALLTSLVSEFAYRAEYTHQSRVINLLEPTAPIQLRRWNFHPECGCVDVRRRALQR